MAAVVLEATRAPEVPPAGGRPITTAALVPGQRTGLESQLPNVKFPSGLTPETKQLLEPART